TNYFVQCSHDTTESFSFGRHLNACGKKPVVYGSSQPFSNKITGDSTSYSSNRCPEWCNPRRNSGARQAGNGFSNSVLEPPGRRPETAAGRLRLPPGHCPRLPLGRGPGGSSFPHRWPLKRRKRVADFPSGLLHGGPEVRSGVHVRYDNRDRTPPLVRLK